MNEQSPYITSYYRYNQETDNYEPWTAQPYDNLYTYNQDTNNYE